jgi:hypothetical protein
MATICVTLATQPTDTRPDRPRADLKGFARLLYLTESLSVRDALREEEFESRWEAAPAVLLVIAGQVVLAVVSKTQDWKLWHLPWWVWLVPAVPEFVIWAALAWELPRSQLVELGLGRRVALTLFGVVSLANAFLVCAVVASLVSGNERSGAQLLLKGVTVWGSNVIAFGLWFWSFDRGGPARRLQPNPPLPDFQFPQMENPELAPKGWQPHLFDYLYISFTNSIAFSPTDAMPLSRWAKGLMLTESAISVAIVLLVAARAVNIFK